MAAQEAQATVVEVVVVAVVCWAVPSWKMLSAQAQDTAQIKVRRFAVSLAHTDASRQEDLSYALGIEDGDIRYTK